MIKRVLPDVCFNPDFGRQMRFIVGPRQCGKTTLAREFLKEMGHEKLYYNWDEMTVRKKYRANPLFYMEHADINSRKKSWICFDEMHKMPKWKNILKGIFDSSEEKMNFVVTGSARLDMLRRAGDSLAGRYFVFKLFPLSLSELSYAGKVEDLFPENSAMDFIEKRLSGNKDNHAEMESLLRNSGFPEPFAKASETFNRRWHDSYMERLIRGDLRDLTQIRELENIAGLMQLLPKRIGNPLSLNSLREDLEVSHNAVRTYMNALELTYMVFALSPYHQSIARSIRKEKKYYFYDWTFIDDEALRFENFIAVELKSLIELWNDAGVGKYGLFYVRTKDGKETDFLITKYSKPWIMFEAKFSDGSIARHSYAQSTMLGDAPVVQLCASKGVVIKESRTGFRVSASRFFHY